MGPKITFFFFANYITPQKSFLLINYVIPENFVIFPKNISKTNQVCNEFVSAAAIPSEIMFQCV